MVDSTSAGLSSEIDTANGNVHLSSLLGPSMGDLITRACVVFSDSCAMQDQHRSISYEVLLDEIERCAYYLQSNGVGKGESVAQLSGNSISAFVVQAACYFLGANYIGLHSTGANKVHLRNLQSGKPEVVVVASDVFASSIEMFEDHGYVVLEYSRDRQPWLMPQYGGRVATISIANDGARLAFTGGTTGLPKPVRLPHRSLVVNTQIALSDLALPKYPKMFLSTPISHGAGAYIVPVLLRGGTVVLSDNFVPDKFAEMVQEGTVNCAFLVPTLIRRLIQVLGDRLGSLSSGLELIIYGAAAASPRDLETVLQSVGPVLQQVYGQTEAPNMVTTLRPEEHRVGDSRLRSIGRATEGASLKIIDSDGEEVVELGRVGELCVAGPLVMDGYVDERTGELFGVESGWLKTGDLAYFDERGYVFVTGRSKEMIITGGFNVYPVLIERVLDRLGTVESAVVVGVPDAYWGEKVVAVVSTSGLIDESVAKEAVLKELGAEWVPKHFVVVDEIPLTSLGKPDRTAALDLAAACLEVHSATDGTYRRQS